MTTECYNRDCHRAITQDRVPLSKCARCQKAYYCSVDCQKQHWPTHKGLCPSTRRALRFHTVTFASRLPVDNEESYGEIIDTFRLRIEDDYAHGGHLHGLYAQKDPLPTFEDFLNRCEALGPLLMPTWWSAETREKCRQQALQVDGNHFIGHAVEKRDVQDFWKDKNMPMQFRMLAENVYGGGYGAGQGRMPRGFQCFCDSRVRHWL